MRHLSFYILLTSLLAGCTGKEESASHHHTPEVAAAPVDSVLMLTNSQIRLAGISTQKIAMSSIGATTALNATLKANEEQTKVISSRAAGRIERLFIKETGRPVRQGEPLYELYSELMLTLQQEYLLAKAQYEALGKSEQRYVSYMKSAERKLLLYGLAPHQITQLGQSRSPQQKITFLAPASGMVTAIDAAEGQYVNEGTPLYRMEDLSTLWAEAALYPNESKLVKTGDEVTLRIGDELTSGKVIFISPEYQQGSQINTLRVTLNNKDLKWKPGMQAEVYLTHSKHQAIAVPLDGVIRSEKAAYAFVLTDQNTFARRTVATGMEDHQKIEITAGIREGETVAVSGAYLLYSEFMLKH